MPPDEVKGRPGKNGRSPDALNVRSSLAGFLLTEIDADLLRLWAKSLHVVILCSDLDSDARYLLTLTAGQMVAIADGLACEEVAGAS